MLDPHALPMQPMPCVVTTTFSGSFVILPVIVALSAVFPLSKDVPNHWLRAKFEPVNVTGVPPVTVPVDGDMLRMVAGIQGAVDITGSGEKNASAMTMSVPYTPLSEWNERSGANGIDAPIPSSEACIFANLISSIPY